MSRLHVCGRYLISSHSKESTTNVLQLEEDKIIALDLGQYTDMSVKASYVFISSPDPEFSKGLLEHAYTRAGMGLPSARYYVPMECIDSLMGAVQEFNAQQKLSLELNLFTLRPGDVILLRPPIKAKSEPDAKSESLSETTSNLEEGKDKSDIMNTQSDDEVEYAVRVFAFHPRRANLGFCVVRRATAEKVNDSGHDVDKKSQAWSFEVCYTGVNPLVSLERLAQTEAPSAAALRYVQESVVLMIECSYLAHKGLRSSAQGPALRGFVTAKQLSERLTTKKKSLSLKSPHVLLFHLPYDGAHNNADVLASQCQQTLPASQRHRIQLSLSAFGVTDCEAAWDIAYAKLVLPPYANPALKYSQDKVGSSDDEALEEAKSESQEKNKRKKKKKSQPLKLPIPHVMISSALADPQGEESLQMTLERLDARLLVVGTLAAASSRGKGSSAAALATAIWMHGNTPVLRVCVRSLSTLINVHYLAGSTPVLKEVAEGKEAAEVFQSGVTDEKTNDDVKETPASPYVRYCFLEPAWLEGWSAANNADFLQHQEQQKDFAATYYERVQENIAKRIKDAKARKDKLEADTEVQTPVDADTPDAVHIDVAPE